MIAFASSLDQCGPLTRDVTDAALLFRHMVGRDRCDSTSLEFPEDVELPSAESLDGLRFGVPPELTGEGIEPGVREVFDATLKRIEELGGTVEEASLPHSNHGISAYYLLAPAEASATPTRSRCTCRTRAPCRCRSRAFRRYRPRRGWRTACRWASS